MYLAVGHELTIIRILSIGLELACNVLPYV